jgi:hypothetical protein
MGLLIVPLVYRSFGGILPPIVRDASPGLLVAAGLGL